MIVFLLAGVWLLAMLLVLGLCLSAARGDRGQQPQVPRLRFAPRRRAG